MFASEDESVLATLRNSSFPPLFLLFPHRLLFFLPAGLPLFLSAPSAPPAAAALPLATAPPAAAALAAPPRAAAAAPLPTAVVQPPVVAAHKSSIFNALILLRDAKFSMHDHDSTRARPTKIMILNRLRLNFELKRNIKYYDICYLSTEIRPPRFP